ncbi:PQQ-dependent sugar dehydrogenase [bacterium BMS3Abin03]|nr:PQQ-dependent sugar dehydrogenase [bacterium BMS3Abin03]
MFILSTKKLTYVLLAFVFIQFSFLNAQPVSLRGDMTIKELADVNYSSVRIVHDPVTDNLYILRNDGVVERVEFNSDTTSTTFTSVYTKSDHGLEDLLGMAFGQDGTLYLVGNSTSSSNNEYGTGTVVKGIPDSLGSEERTWSILAETVEYPFGRIYNHRMSGIAVDPNGEYIYVNSGARTDHGEERDGFREVGLTSIILKLPADGDTITLQNSREWLRTHDYIMAEGIRNDFCLAFSGNGDLFSVENSGDRDDPEEMNWIREGHHYGFPWRIGGNNTPQQFAGYNPMNDPLLAPNAWGGGDLYGTFYNDSLYPSPPDSVTFTEPVMNYGPDADSFRDTLTGEVKDASELGIPITTFTPHRSPDGIVFDKDSSLAWDLKGDAFVISLAAGNTFTPLQDTSQDLLHIKLTKMGDSLYKAHVTRLAYGFIAPLGIELVGNKLFIVETGLWSRPFNAPPKLYEITLPIDIPITDVNTIKNSPVTFKLYQNYPNPFNPTTKIKYTIAPPNLSKGETVGTSFMKFVKLKIFDILGNEVATLVNEEKQAGSYEVEFNASKLSSGVYLYRLQAGDLIQTKKLILLK